MTARCFCKVHGVFELIAGKVKAHFFSIIAIVIKNIFYQVVIEICFAFDQSLD